MVVINMINKDTREPLVGDFQSDEMIPAREETVNAMLGTILSHIPEGAKGVRMTTFDRKRTMNFFRSVPGQDDYFDLLAGFSEGTVGGYIFTEGYDPTVRIGTISEKCEGIKLLRENEAKALKERMEMLVPVAVIK